MRHQEKVLNIEILPSWPLRGEERADAVEAQGRETPLAIRGKRKRGQLHSMEMAMHQADKPGG